MGLRASYSHLQGHAMRAKENTDGTASAFGKCQAFLCFKNWWWKSLQALRYEHERKNISQGGRAQRIRPCCWGRGSSISQPHEWQATSMHFLSSLYREKLWEKSEGLALPRLEQWGAQEWSLNDSPKQKKNKSSNEKHTHRSWFSPAMPRTSFPGHNCANGLFAWPRTVYKR